MTELNISNGFLLRRRANRQVLSLLPAAPARSHRIASSHFFSRGTGVVGEAASAYAVFSGVAKISARAMRPQAEELRFSG